MESSGAVTMAALGRPFSLGMLYDCRKDILVAGMTLWDDEDLQKHVRETNQGFSDFEMLASNSLQDKSNALEVDASLKASFMGGMVDIQGSAKYLKNTKTSNNHARVTVKYTTTTTFKELSMEHLAEVKYQNVFEKELATHVVTAILYGAHAFLVFDKEVSDTENLQDIQGKLQIAVKNIPSVSITGEGAVDWKDHDKTAFENSSCKFHGDFFLDNNPTTAEEAIKLYHNLPTFLKPTQNEATAKDKQTAVPVKVWMLPLTSLNSSASKMVRQISVGLVQEAQKALEEFSELEIRFNDAMKLKSLETFPQIAEKLKYFNEMCTEFKLGYQQSLAEKLPLIRGGREEEAKLAEILKNRHSSPFNTTSLNQWMDYKEKEIWILEAFIKMMKNTTFIASEIQLYQEALSAHMVYCFVFTSLGRDEPFLSALSAYLKGTRTDNQNQGLLDVEKEQWYSSKETRKDIMKKAKAFNDQASSDKNAKYLAVGLTHDHKDSTTYYYLDGFLENDMYEFTHLLSFPTEQ
ncbi:stonustoxin subunit alpha-like [Gambusia affinis]|uniref:stonustoxin subunit alpha-like n=1 Tax=Gambusia affinis TaxID=33528 RepID=UPI001CDBA2F4|nr:stonustoxin subunit alpha-like [Gambusia affinis]XP_043952546.1 stonustoxin subunit alpha-like [Gambusia affinis]XP_043952547.1 stonustoxin subunit alpha-like [Gambusia affinis]